MGFIREELVVCISYPCGQSLQMAFAVGNVQKLQFPYVTAPRVIVKFARFDITQHGVFKENFAKSPTLKGQIISVQ